MRPTQREANSKYLSDEEQRQRVREVVKREKGEDCPDLVVVRAEAILGGGHHHHGHHHNGGDDHGDDD
jgi:hypothetical protein